jgi:phosphatidylglycerophosphatase A
LQKLFLTFFYSGLCPKAPGTAGTITAAAAGWAILQIMPVSTLFLLTAFVSVIAVSVINRYEISTNTHDNSQIVIDEVVGVWLAMCIAANFSADIGAQVGAVQVLICVVFFRFFDIAKPSIIGRIDRNVEGGLGVIGDDIIAGIFAGIVAAGVWNLIKHFEIVQNYNF